ncbi:MAG: GNAT family N-acetyltransferase [Candidatus Thorarchaeota archaeon]
MKIIDLEEGYEHLYMVCLEDWSDEIKEAGDHKKRWYDKMKDKGLRVKLALNDNDEAVGMIQYVPIEKSPAKGTNLYFINCIWVHGYDEGVGNYQKKGIGKKLLEAAENDIKSKGGLGIVAWGVSLPFWMRASWYKKQGYEKVDKDGISVLLWKPFSKDAIIPRWFRQMRKPESIPGKVTVTAFINGWCPAQNIVFERAKKAANEFGDKVEFQKIDTFNRETFEEWGIYDALFIDGKEVRTGPPPTYEDLLKKIRKRIKKTKMRN